jgi:uncharacterized protein
MRGVGHFFRTCMKKFIGRDQELVRLEAAVKKSSASFIVIKGRRRIGKSRLIEEFGKTFPKCYMFRGLVPNDGTTKQEQINEFARQARENLNLPNAQYSDWGDVFLAISQQVDSGKVLLAFDEISWMGSKDNTFLPKLKDLWDVYLKKNNKLIFIVCGSASAWIEKNIMSSAGFVGRVSFSITLKELSLASCRAFWPKNISHHEILKVLSITGGVPRYLEEINPKETAEQNIKKLCFTDGGLLVNEFHHIFSDIFLRKSDSYRKIVAYLAKGSADLSQIQSSLNLTSSGRVAEYLYELELAGFVARDFSWKLKTGEDAKASQFRLKDNYLRFYLKYIEKNKSKLQRSDYIFKGFSNLSGWYSVLGLQFENLILSNRQLVFNCLNINEKELIADNPYYQKGTKVKKGCQIDYMIQTKFGSLYVCEIKFSIRPIGLDIIGEIEAKISALSVPKGISIRPVLICVNGVTKELGDSGYFSNIIISKDLFL